MEDLIVLGIEKGGIIFLLIIIVVVLWITVTRKTASKESICIVSEPVRQK